MLVLKKTHERKLQRIEKALEKTTLELMRLTDENEELRAPAALHVAKGRAATLVEAEASLRAEVAAHGATKGLLDAAKKKEAALRLHYESLIATIMEQKRLA